MGKTLRNIVLGSTLALSTIGCSKNPADDFHPDGGSRVGVEQRYTDSELAQIYWAQGIDVSRFSSRFRVELENTNPADLRQAYENGFNAELAEKYNNRFHLDQIVFMYNRNGTSPKTINEYSQRFTAWEIAVLTTLDIEPDYANAYDSRWDAGHIGMLRLLKISSAKAKLIDNKYAQQNLDDFFESMIREGYTKMKKANPVVPNCKK
jgi:hypothetical protein